MKVLLSLILISLTLFLFACSKDDSINANQNCEPSSVNDTLNSCMLTKTEMNGVSFENINFAINASHVTPIKDVNASWVTTMPFGYVYANDDSVKYDSEWQWHGERSDGVIEIIELCHAQNLKVMVKPHIWAVGQWIGDVEYQTEEEWQRFEKSYTNYVLRFAHISDSLQVEAFSIGVEMRKVVQQRPDFFTALIDTVRTVYSGPLTYAANWDNYENVNFWNALDYIGIDAYFPVSDSKTPTVEECYNGWEPSFNTLKNLSNSVNKKVVFTEFGYRNVDYTGKMPWDENNNTTFNSKAQENAYKAIFCRFWGEDWFEGGFLWKWHADHNEAGGDDNNRFTPQNKPVEQLISEIFAATN